MSVFTIQLCFALILCSLHFSSSSSLELKKPDFHNGNGNDVSDRADRSDGYYDYEDDLELSVGAIIGISIAMIVICCGIPALLCFCCAWCCFRSRRNRGDNSTVVVAAPMPQQYVPQQYPLQQYSSDAVHHQNETFTNGTTNAPPTYGAGQNQNYGRDNMGFSVYPGSGQNLPATQSTNQYYNYNYNNGAPPPNPRFTSKKPTHANDQRPSYSNAEPQSQYPKQQYQPPNQQQ